MNSKNDPILSLLKEKVIEAKKKLTPKQIEETFSVAFPVEWKEYKDSLPLNKYLNRFITINPQMLDVKNDIRKLADVDDPVLIQGETGTGKELLANALQGDRGGPFIAINCAGIPETLVETELFGHTAGAFTDAKKEKAGLLVAAYNGTIFLDEVGELPMSIQAKLLRAVQEKKVRRVGADLTEEKDITINCRIVCATHRDLKAMVSENKFREDLYWRLETFTVKTTPIRIRTEDIKPIVKNMLARQTKEEEEKINYHIEEDLDEFCDRIMKIATDKERGLKGNVREIESIVRNYQILGRWKV